MIGALLATLALALVFAVCTLGALAHQHGREFANRCTPPILLAVALVPFVGFAAEVAIIGAGELLAAIVLAWWTP